MRHLSVACWCNKASTQLITISSIKSSGNLTTSANVIDDKRSRLTDDKVRIKFVCDRHHYMLESEHVIGISHAFSRPRNVDVSVPN